MISSNMLGIASSLAMICQSIESGNEEWKDKIMNEWKKSKDYPRKMKKKVRKGLLLDWRIANWNPDPFQY